MTLKYEQKIIVDDILARSTSRLSELEDAIDESLLLKQKAEKVLMELEELLSEVQTCTRHH